MYKFIFPILFLFSLNVSANDHEKIKAKCNLISSLSVVYMLDLKEMEGVQVDSINYRDPLKKMTSSIYERMGESNIDEDFIYIVSQAAINGNELWKEVKVSNNKEKEISIMTSVNKLACMYKHKLTLDDIQKLRD